MVVGILALALSALSLVLNLAGAGAMAANAGGHGGGDPAEAVGHAVGGVLGAALGLVWGGLVTGGAVQMRRMQSYGLAMTACIIAMLPCNACCILGLPFGIWGLTVLNRPEVKEAFS
jgi:hypothetical protein